MIYAVNRWTYKNNSVTACSVERRLYCRYYFYLNIFYWIRSHGIGVVLKVKENCFDLMNLKSKIWQHLPPDLVSRIEHCLILCLFSAHTISIVILKSFFALKNKSCLRQTKLCPIFIKDNLGQNIFEKLKKNGSYSFFSAEKFLYPFSPSPTVQCCLLWMCRKFYDICRKFYDILNQHCTMGKSESRLKPI